MRLSPLLLCLAACAPALELPALPDAPIAPSAAPELVPLAPVLDGLSARGASDSDAASELLTDARRLQSAEPRLGTGAITAQEVAALQARARVLRGDASDIDALRAALDALP